MSDKIAPDQGTGFSALPSQKLPKVKKTKEWGKACLNYYSNYRYTNGTTIRTDRFRKLINYDLYNGKINQQDVESICNPLGVTNSTWSSRFQHYDIISESMRLLIGEEHKRPDNSLVISEAPDDVSRKTKGLQQQLVQILERDLMADIDPSTIDSNNPPPKPEDVAKYERYTPSDIIESKANKILKVLKKRLNTKLLFNQGWKDALIAGEEIYWVGIANGQPMMRRCNPVNITAIMDDDHTFIDDAVAIVEERMMTISSILDEFGDLLSKTELDTLENYTRGTFGNFNTAGGYEPQFTIVDGNKTFAGVTPTNAYNGNNTNNYSIRVCRVEWISMQKVGHLTYTDPETGELTEDLEIDEEFNLKLFKMQYPDAEVEWFWINQAWEGIKIGIDIYVGMQPKPNQRRRMDNPYHCQLGYTGFIYEATNSQSVSLVDRLKPYQYLYDIIAYRLELAFASDQGKIFLMDLAQIPESQGIDRERWLYYMKEMKIAFINSFEEGKKGSQVGQLSKFNQFQAIDLSLSQSIQQYINFLDYLKQQIYFVSGVTPQRLGAINSNELVGNVEKAVTQSSLITEYLFEAHNEVKRRTYTALIEVAKVAYKNGLTAQYVLDDMGMEILHLDEFEFENSEFSVFVSNLSKDTMLKDKLDQLVQIELQQGRVGLSTIIETLLNDSPRDIVNILKKAEDEFAQQQQKMEESKNQAQNQALEIQKQMHAEDLQDKQADRDLKQYEIDTNNETKLRIAEINTYIGAEDMDQNGNGIPDPAEIAANALKERELDQKNFNERMKIQHDNTKHSKEISLKEKELSTKKEIEDKKIEAIKIQNASQEKMQKEKMKTDKELAEKKLKIERMKARKKPSK